MESQILRMAGVVQLAFQGFRDQSDHLGILEPKESRVGQESKGVRDQLDHMAKKDEMVQLGSLVPSR